jgi:hypothetical protein
VGDTLQLVRLDPNNMPIVVADLNRLTADRGYYLERDTLVPLAPGDRGARWAQGSGRYAGARQIGEQRSNATLTGTFAVKGGAYGTVESDKTQADAEALASYLDSPDVVGAGLNASQHWLLFQPEFGSRARRTLYKLMGAVDWRPRYIRNAFTGGNVMALEMTAPIAPKAYGLPLDFRDTADADTLADWTANAGLVWTGANIRQDAAALGMVDFTAINDKRGYAVNDREILARFLWDAGTDSTEQSMGAMLKYVDADNWLAVALRNRAAGQADPVKAYFRIGGVPGNVTLLGGTVDYGTSFWIRARIVGDVIWWEFRNSATEPLVNTTMIDGGTIPLSSINGGLPGAVGAGKVGYGGFFTTLAPTAQWRLAEYVDRPYTQRSFECGNPPASGGGLVLRGIPGTADADAAVEIYHRSGNRPRFALVGWRDYSRQPALGGTPPFAKFSTASGLTAGAGFALDAPTSTPNAAAQRHDALAAGAADRAVYVNFIAANMVGDAFAGDVIPIAVWAFCRIPATMVTPRLAARVEPIPATTWTYAVDSGVSGRSLVMPSSGSPDRFFPVGIVLVDRRATGTQRITVLLSYAPGSSGIFYVDSLLLAPARHMAVSPVGKLSADYPDFMGPGGAANWIKRVETDLSGRIFDPAAALGDTGFPHSGLGGSRLEIPPTDTEFVVKVSDRIPDDPTPSSSSDAGSIIEDVHIAVQPCYRLWRSD